MAKKAEHIDTGNHPVYIGDQVFDHLNKLLDSKSFQGVKLFVLADDKTMNYCLPLTISKVNGLEKAEIIEIDNGESSKSLEVCNQIWLTLSEYGAERNSVVINLGGGVISDIGGFVASTFKRGIRFINLPTTLLAQVDASLGGKTGVDLGYLKNQVGTFADPEAVFIFPGYLETLDKRQLLSGFAECIKHGLIADKSYWNIIRKTDVLDNSSWEKLIQASVEIKNKIVKADRNEKGIRKTLNFGHTIGHAIETWSLENQKSPLLHGEAIAIGMLCEAWLSHKILKLSAKDLNDITLFLLQQYRHVKLGAFDSEKLIDLMKHDKKNEGGKIQFSLIKQIGEADFNNAVEPELIIEALEYYPGLMK